MENSSNTDPRDTLPLFEGGFQAPLHERLLSFWRVPGISKLEDLLRTFSPSERALLYSGSILMGASVFLLLILLNTRVTETTPSYGGTFTEGIVGTPRFINPLLASSDADRDLTALVYSGLMRATPDDVFIKDLAADFTLSEDGTVYTFTIRDDARFHDGNPITAGDVAFTVAMAQHPDMKSPRRADWEGVVVEEVDSHTIRFTLPRPYAPFLEVATIGILPKHLWQNIAVQEMPFHALNTKPVGSGPFVIRKTKSTSDGTPERYTLSAFRDFTLGRPFLDTLTFHFYPNEEELFVAFERGAIDSIAGVAPEKVERFEKGHEVIRAPLPRVFAIFFNQARAPIFTDSAVRKALSVAIDKDEIIIDNLLGYGVPIDGPALFYAPPEEAQSEQGVEAAASILEKAGWKVGDDGVRANKKGKRLAFSITTADAPQLAGTAESVARMWRIIGADVTVKVFSMNDLSSAVIRPREYEALLFGEVVGRGLDLFAFWHSSQRNDPGLNLALYTSVKGDKLLTDARRDINPETRLEKTREFVELIQEEYPAAFLYAPEFIYIVPHGLSGIEIGSLTTPSERFLNAHEWYQETERVWSIFTPEEAPVTTY